MPTPAFARVLSGLSRADDLRRAGADAYAASRVLSHAEARYGAAIVFQAAAWEGYVEDLTRLFFSRAGVGATGQLRALYSLLEARAVPEIKRFNTPNSDHTRTLLLSFAGYDPWPDWNISKLRLNSIQSRHFLDDMMSIRHSFAHGFSMPRLSWLLDARGRVRLTSATVRRTGNFIRALGEQTDQGFRNHVHATFGVTL